MDKEKDGWEPKWIYCRDELPPDGGLHVFVALRSLVDDREPWTTDLFYCRILGKSHWGFGPDRIPMVEYGEAEVYAWMPKIFPKPPEPYQEEQGP